MRILYLTATNTVGAGNRVLLSWIDYFLSKGNHLAACCPAGGALSQILKERLGSFYKEVEFFSLTKIKILKSLLTLLSFSLQFRPNLIHCNAEISYYLVRYVAKLLKIPVFVHIRFHFGLDFYSWLFKRHYMPEGIFFVSKALLEEEYPKLPAYIKNTNKLFVLHNCLKDPLNNMAIQCSRPNIFKIGCFGPIQERKNQESLVYLAKKFKDKRLPVHIYVAGFVREHKYYERISALVRELGVGDYITFLGHVEDVFFLMSSMFITISVSKYETFGVSVLESMALGVPVVSYFVPAIAEVLNGTGIIVPFGDLDSLFDACLYLISDRSAYLKYSKLARQRYLDFFSPEKICPYLENYYLSALS